VWYASRRGETISRHPIVANHAGRRGVRCTEVVVYFTESRNTPLAVIKLRRSDFIEARYAFSLCSETSECDRGRMPMITTRSELDQCETLRFIFVHSFLLFRLGTVRARL